MATLATLLLAATLQAQDWSQVKIHPTKITDNMYVLSGGGGNVALLIGDDAALLVDATCAEIADKLVAAVESLTDKPIRLVINTHWHFDHVGGNEALTRAGATIIAHEAVRTRMEKQNYITGVDRDIPPSPPDALPTTTFTDKLVLHFAGEEIRVMHVDPAHTDGDSFVYFARADVLHLGDTCFSGMYTFFDVNAGGSLDGIIQALDKALKIATDKTQIIPGHGGPLNKPGLAEYRNMLTTVRDRVRTLIKDGKSRDEVIAAKPTADLDARWGKTWLTADLWVGLIYDGMTAQTAKPGTPATNSPQSDS